MRKILIALLSSIFLLTLVPGSPVDSQEPGLWLPEGFDWSISYSMVCDAFCGMVYEMPAVEREKGAYTGILAGETPQGFMFTFCNGKLVGICVAYEASYAGTPLISDVGNVEGYTRTYKSSSGNWTYVESGLRGYEVLNWENNLGMKSNRLTSTGSMADIHK